MPIHIPKQHHASNLFETVVIDEPASADERELSLYAHSGSEDELDVLWKKQDHA